MIGDHVLDPGRMGAAQVQDRLDRLHLDPRAREFQTTWPDAGLQESNNRARPIGHGAQRQTTRRPRGIGQEALDCTHAFALVGQGPLDQPIGNARKHFSTAMVARDDPLIAIPTHVAHRDIGQTIGVIDTGLTRHRKEVAWQFRDRQFQERHEFGRTPIIKAHFHPVVGPKLQVRYRLGLWVEQSQKGMEAFGRGIVRTWRADDIDPAKAKRRLDRAQRIDLARDADDGDALMPRYRRRFEGGQSRRIAHAHTPALRQRCGVGDDHGFRPPAVMRISAHGEHGIDLAPAQEIGGKCRGDPAPLRPVCGRVQPQALHRKGDPKECLIPQGGVGHAPMHAMLGAGIIGLDELTGLSTGAPIAHAADAAIGAKPRTRRSRKNGNAETGCRMILGHGGGLSSGRAEYRGERKICQLWFTHTWGA